MSAATPNIKPLSLEELKPALAPVLVTDEAGLSEVADFFQRVSVFGFDTETNIAKTFVDRKIRTIQVGDRSEQYVIDLLAFAGSTEKLMEQGGKKTPAWALPVVNTLRPALESKDHTKVGANLQFDYEVMCWCLGMRVWNFYDVQLAEKVIYAGRVNFFATGFWALDDLVARYCHLQISKDEQKTFDLETPLTPNQISYAALDTRLPLAVMSAQKAVISQAQLERTVQVENDAIPAFGEMHINGVLLDRTKWLALVKSNEEKHAANVQALDTHFVSIVGTREGACKWSQESLANLEKVWRDEGDKELRKEARKNYQAACREHKAYTDQHTKWEGAAAINYGSSTQLLEAMRKMGFGIKILPNTNDKTLAKLSDRPVIQAIQNYRETSKNLTTYGVSWLDNINPTTGRIHSRINQMGAETGRTSSSAPNIQNIKKEKQYRGCFVARPGHKIVGVDMSGAELRIMADDSGDEVWIAAFEQDWDIHSIGAEMAEPEKWAACTLENCEFAKTKKKCACPGHKKLRDDNKATSFGVAYGMEEAALAARLHISKEDAAKKLTNWRKANSGVFKYLENSGAEAKMKLCARDMIGRRRLFEKPDWNRASSLALERAIEDAVKKEVVVARAEGRKPRPKEVLVHRAIDAKAVERVYYALWGAVEREGKNMKVQGTNASIAKMAMGAGFDSNGKPFLWHLLPQYDAEMQNFIHDEDVCEAPDANAEAVSETIKDCFLRAGAEVLRRVQMLSEAHIGDCWSK